ncbi:MAG: hypothetical protein KAH03_05085 [Cocleimonas sp.]|nr:hypothetical protein [Cocleimonas sp.]
MGNNINGQSHVQQRNNVPNNDQAKANFTGANQMPVATPMSQSQILNQLMNMIQQLISALQGEPKEQSTNKDTTKKSEEKAKKQTDTSSSKAKTNTTDNASNSTTAIKDSVKLPGETYNDTGLVRIKDQADGSSSSGNSATQRTAGAGGPTTTPPTLQAPGAYDAKFNIDPDLRACNAGQCITTGYVDQDHTGSVGVIPYKHAPDFGLVNDPDRGWKTTGLNTSFRHTFHPAAPGQGEIYKPGETDANGNVTGGSYIEIEISRTTLGSLTSNDSFNLVSNGSTVGPGTSVWNYQGNSGLQSDTIKIPLTAAQVTEIQNTGRASFLVSDDTAVDSMKLHLDIGKQVPANTITGTTSDDDLKGKTGQPDIIHGLAGDDTIDGESGDDCLYGDEGDDHIRGGSGDDKAFGGTGDDRIEGGSGKDKLFGNEGDDKIFGGSGDDIMFGDEGDDELHGGSGDDKIFALDGNDTVFGDSGNDHIYSGLGPLDPTGQHNIIDGGSGDDTVHYSGMYDANNPANSDYFVNTIGPNEWEVIDKQTGKRDIIKNVEKLVFEMNPGGPFTLNITSDK